MTGIESDSLMYELKNRVAYHVMCNERPFRELIEKHLKYSLNQDEESIKDTNGLILSILDEWYWAGPFQILATATYLRRPIQIFGCHYDVERRCNFNDCINKHGIHFLYEPLEQCDTSSPITLMNLPQYGKPGKNVKADHFEPLLPNNKRYKDFWEESQKAPLYKVD